MAFKVAARRVFGSGGYQVVSPPAPAAAGGAGGASFASDLFTDTAGTALASHTPTLGGPWVKHPSDAQPAVISDANRLRSNASGATALFYITGVPTTVEYDVQADFVYIAATSTIFTGVVGRADTSANTCYVARYDLGNTRWQLLQLVAGVGTSLGTFTQTITAPNTYVVKLQIRDATKKLFVDGVERISDNTNVITAAGKAGVRLSDGSAVNGNGLHLDNFVATNA